MNKSRGKGKPSEQHIGIIRERPDRLRQIFLGFVGSGTQPVHAGNDNRGEEIRLFFFIGNSFGIGQQTGQRLARIVYRIAAFVKPVRKIRFRVGAESGGRLGL